MSSAGMEPPKQVERTMETLRAEMKELERKIEYERKIIDVYESKIEEERAKPAAERDVDAIKRWNASIEDCRAAIKRCDNSIEDCRTVIRDLRAAVAPLVSNPAVTALTQQMGRLVLADAVMHVRLARFDDPLCRDSVEVSGTEESIMDALHTAIRGQFGENSGKPVNVCTWLPKTNGRTRIDRGQDIRRHFAAMHAVWFWVGTPDENPPSPDKDTKILRQRLDALEVAAVERQKKIDALEVAAVERQKKFDALEVERQKKIDALEAEQQRLRVNSASSAALQLEYSKRTEWTIEALKSWLCSSGP